VGTYTRSEYDACIAGLNNKGCLNCVLELARVAYGPLPVTGFDAFTEALKKRKTDSLRKPR
jgi:hypothetical protein